MLLRLPLPTRLAPRQRLALGRNLFTVFADQYVGDQWARLVRVGDKSVAASPWLSEKDSEEDKEEQEELPTLRNDYAALSQQLEQLDVNKRAGQWARLYKQVRAAEARLRQAEQETPPSTMKPPEYAKQQGAQDSRGEMVKPSVETTISSERQDLLRTIASEVLYWRAGLKVLRMTRLPKWLGWFKWQIEAKLEALQTAYAILRAEDAKQDE